MPQALDLVPSSDSHGHDVLGGLNERHVQERRQPAARLDLSPGPVGLIRPGLRRVESLVPRRDSPDRDLLVKPREMDEQQAVEPLCTGKFRRQVPGIVADADEEDVRIMVVQPREETPEHAG